MVVPDVVTNNPNGIRMCTWLRKDRTVLPTVTHFCADRSGTISTIVLHTVLTKGIDMLREE